MKEQLKIWASSLHQIPEIGLKEFKTTAYLKNELEKMGYQPQSCLETGCYVYIDAKKDKTIAFRSDIDGLSIQEESCHAYPSMHQGFMHACGHDGHMAMLLGLAKALKNQELSYNVLLIFQPAEEFPGGAKLLVEKGLLKQYHVDAIFGFHLSPSYPLGEVAFKSGAMMAQCGELNVTIIGKSAHAGTPHEGVDALLIASELVSMYSSIITKQIKPSELALIHIGELHSGSARNVVASKAIMRGTVRAFSEDTFERLVNQIKKLHQGFESMYDCHIETECVPMYPPVINDEHLSDKLFNFLNVTKMKEPVMLAEDFSFYQKEVPGVFLFLGTKTDMNQSPLHSSTFYFDDNVLEIGVNTYLDILKHIQL